MKAIYLVNIALDLRKLSNTDLNQKINNVRIVRIELDQFFELKYG